MMKTTLSIDDDTANQLMRVTGEKSHPAAILHALNSYLKQVHKQKTLALRGQVDIADNWQTLRKMEKSECDQKP